MTSSLTERELNAPNQESLNSIEMADEHSSSASVDTLLPPADGGKQAWLVLVGCSLIQAPVWGFSLTFGVFQNYFTQSKELQGDKKSISNIGTSASGILYLLSPITFTLLTRYPRLRRYCGPVGLILSLLGLVLGSFATEVWQLIATLGIISSMGNGMLYSPSTLYLDEWFVKRKGLAYGIMGASKSFVGVVLPFVTGASLEKFGPATVLRAWAVMTLLVTAPLLHYLKPRVPLAASTHARGVSLDFLRLPSFWILQTGNIFQSLGYFLPSAYLASYATDIGLSPQIGTLMIALLNATSVPGSILHGILNDKYHVLDVILASTMGSAIAVLVFWGLADHVALLAIFAIFYGFFAGGFSSTWTGIMKQLQRENPALDTGFVYGLLAGARGLGNIASGPISSALIVREIDGSSIGGYDTSYRYLIVFTGATALLGGWGYVGRAWQKL